VQTGNYANDERADRERLPTTREGEKLFAHPTGGARDVEGALDAEHLGAGAGRDRGHIEQMSVAGDRSDDGQRDTDTVFPVHPMGRWHTASMRWPSGSTTNAAW
jgi:hypothetical protein